MSSASNVNAAARAHVVVSGHGDHVDQAGKQKQKAEQDGDEQTAAGLFFWRTDVTALRVRTNNITGAEVLRRYARRRSGKRESAMRT